MNTSITAPSTTQHRKDDKTNFKANGGENNLSNGSGNAQGRKTQGKEGITNSGPGRARKDGEQQGSFKKPFSTGSNKGGQQRRRGQRYSEGGPKGEQQTGVQQNTQQPVRSSGSNTRPKGRRTPVNESLNNKIQTLRKWTSNYWSEEVIETALNEHDGVLEKAFAHLNERKQKSWSNIVRKQSPFLPPQERNPAPGQQVQENQQSNERQQTNERHQGNERQQGNERHQGNERQQSNERQQFNDRQNENQHQHQNQQFNENQQYSEQNENSHSNNFQAPPPHSATNNGSQQTNKNKRNKNKKGGNVEKNNNEHHNEKNERETNLVEEEYNADAKIQALQRQFETELRGIEAKRQLLTSLKEEVASFTADRDSQIDTLSKEKEHLALKRKTLEQELQLIQGRVEQIDTSVAHLKQEKVQKIKVLEEKSRTVL